MNYSDFVWICGLHNIEPSIALEDEMVKKILKMNLQDINKQLLLSNHLKENL